MRARYSVMATSATSIAIIAACTSLKREEVRCQNARLVGMRNKDVGAFIPSRHPDADAVDQVPTVRGTCDAIDASEAPRPDVSVVVHSDSPSVPAVNGSGPGPTSIRLDYTRRRRRLARTEQQAQHSGQRNVLSGGSHSTTVASVEAPGSNRAIVPNAYLRLRYSRISSSMMSLMSRPSITARALNSRRRSSGNRKLTCEYRSSERFPVFARWRRFTSVTPQDATTATLGDTLRHSMRLSDLTPRQIRANTRH